MNKLVANEIKKIAETIRKENGFEGKIIGEDIFKILRTKGKIIFFPLDDEPDLDGFHIKRTINGIEEAYIYINTTKKVEKNIFCAAHELGHIYDVDERIYSLNLDYRMVDAEDIMNRFAAELLMPQVEFTKVLEEKLPSYSEKDNKIYITNLIKLIVFLMDYFFVPYKAVIYRLEEIGFLKEEYRISLSKIDDEVVNSFIYEGNYTKLIRDNRLKDFDGLQEELLYAEENHVYGPGKIKKIRKEFDIPNTDEEKLRSIEDEYIKLDIKTK